MILLQQMVVLFIMMLVGFICRKRGMLSDEANKKISGLVVNVANPALILSAAISDHEGVSGKELLQTVILAVVVFAVLICLAHVIPKLLKTPGKDEGIYRVMMVFSNIGFMGFPILAAVYGSESLLYGSVFLIPYNILIYTYGIQTMKPKGKEKEPFRVSSIFNIGVIACILTVILYFLRLPIPDFVETAVLNLSNLTAPLSMIVIGDSLTKMNIKSLFLDRRMLLFSGIKLLLIPVCATFLIKGIGLSPMLTGVCMIMLATPVGSMTAMLAQQCDGDYELASRGVALTTILTVITIPLVSIITGA